MSLSPKIKILLIDDHQLFNDGLKSLLITEEEIEIVAQIFDVKNAFFEIQKHSPDVILLDINLPHKNGIELASEIQKAFTGVKIIFLTMYEDSHIYKEALKVGPSGYVLKNSSKLEIMKAINAAHKGLTYFDSKMKGEPQSEKRDALSKKFGLTEREKEIIRFIKAGLDSYQIANKTNLSYLTIKTHRRNIHFKLGTKTISELIKFANENGL
ncbi:DNA-binding response regulator [Lacihabitans sp. CCS-44]|uniref:response regulator n=1 Tax=Lacihabitans sp. CCS-44 TaxID=2487331 RepID=UPI0020CE41DA|nr:response regulator transcription factor [Lacihabitans sp. CCS-44]MCP9756617.1 DNA-binding response regulator [Lacihabitans sp. CCS-44]